MSTAPAALSSDVPVLRTRVVSTSMGDVTIRALDVRAFFRIAGALQKLEFDDLPTSIDMTEFADSDFLDKLAAAESLTERAQLMAGLQEHLPASVRNQVRQRGLDRIRAIIRWVMQSESLLAVVFDSLTDLGERDLKSLKIVEVMKLANAIADLLLEDWEDLSEAFLGFFTRLGEFMEKFNAKQKEINANAAS